MTLEIVWHILCVPLAVAYAHIAEWLIHKYILHGLGKNKKSSWAFHWHNHHKECRKNDNFDKGYRDGWSGPQLREKLSLIALVLIHLPLITVAPLFVTTLAICAKRYYLIHKHAHLNPSWCKTHLPWHYDHHMGKNQDANWGVTVEWVDKLMGTRIKYHEDDKSSA